MTFAGMEVDEALKSAGVADEPACRAAKAMGGVGQITQIEKRLERLESDMQSVKTDATLLKWIAGFQVALTTAVLGKLLIP